MHRLAAIFAEAVTVDMAILGFMGQMLALIAMVVIAILTYTKRKSDRAEREATQEALKRIEFMVAGSIDTVNSKHQALKEVVDKHVSECNKINKETLQTQIEQLDSKAAKASRFNHWVAKCIAVLFTKLNIAIPEHNE